MKGEADLDADWEQHDAPVRAAVPGRPWELMMPPGWWRIPTRADLARPAIQRLLDRTFQRRARDELIGLRIDLDRELTAAVKRAGEQGATHLYTLVDPIAGVPVSADLVVTPISAVAGRDITRDVIAALSDDAGLLERGRVVVGDRPALRRLRRTREKVVVAGQTTERWQTTLDLVVDLGPDDLLMLTFSTVTDEVHRELVLVFDAIASTLRQVDVGGGLAADQPNEKP